MLQLVNLLIAVVGVRGNTRCLSPRLAQISEDIFREAAGARREAVVILICSRCLLAILLSIFLAVRHPAVHPFSCSSKIWLDIQCLNYLLPS